jgi:hypothetical protein
MLPYFTPPLVRCRLFIEKERFFQREWSS